MLIGVLLSETFRDMPPLFSFLSCAGDGHMNREGGSFVLGTAKKEFAEQFLVAVKPRKYASLTLFSRPATFMNSDRRKSIRPWDNASADNTYCSKIWFGRTRIKGW